MSYFPLVLAAMIAVAAYFGYRDKNEPFSEIMWRVGMMFFLLGGITWEGHQLPGILLVPLAYITVRA